MAEYYDRKGRPMDMAAWARKFEEFDYKRVAFDNKEPR